MYTLKLHIMHMEYEVLHAMSCTYTKLQSGGQETVQSDCVCGRNPNIFRVLIRDPDISVPLYQTFFQRISAKNQSPKL